MVELFLFYPVKWSRAPIFFENYLTGLTHGSVVSYNLIRQVLLKTQKEGSVGKNYTTWTEARKILGKNFYDLVDLQDMHPDLRLMPEEWEQFQLIPYSVEQLTAHKNRAILFPAIDHDVNGNLINFLWFNENFPGIFQISGEKPTINSMLDTYKEFISHAPEQRWHLIFKEEVHPFICGRTENLVTYIFIAMLHYRKTGILLWQNIGTLIFSDDQDFHKPLQGTGNIFAFECLAGKSYNGLTPYERIFQKATLPDPDPQTIIAPFPRRHDKDVCVIFNLDIFDYKRIRVIKDVPPNQF